MRPKLLIAEGDHAWRRGLQVLFANRGWEVTLASTVAEGLALLDPRLDFLILDWALPDAGGGVILRRVRDAGLKTRVAVTTGTSDADQQREIRHLRPEAVLAKPVIVADVWREAGAACPSLTAQGHPREGSSGDETPLGSEDGLRQVPWIIPRRITRPAVLGRSFVLKLPRGKGVNPCSQLMNDRSL